MELAAAEVEDVAVAGELVAEVGGEGVDVVLAVFFHFEETGFAEDAEVFSGVEFRHKNRNRLRGDFF